MKPRINPDDAITSRGNSLRWRVDEEAQIPAGSPLDDTTTFDAPCWDALGMEPHLPYPWDVDTCALWGFEGIRKRDTGGLVALAFESGLLGQLLLTPLPGHVGCIQHGLQRMARDAELFAVVSKQVAENWLTRKF